MKNELTKSWVTIAISLLSLLCVFFLRLNNWVVAPIASFLITATITVFTLMDYAKEKRLKSSIKKPFPSELTILYIYFNDEDELEDTKQFSNVEVTKLKIDQDSVGYLELCHLPKANCLFLVWDQILLSSNHYFIFNEINEWSKKNEQKPIIVLTKNDKEKTNAIKFSLFRKYHITSFSKQINELAVKIISQSLARTNSFAKLYKNNNFWLNVAKIALLAAAIIFYISYNFFYIGSLGISKLPMLKFTDTISETTYLDYKTKELQRTFNDEDFSISYWWFPQKRNVNDTSMKKIYLTTAISDTLTIRNSFAGFLCNDTNCYKVFGWRAPNLFEMDSVFCWDNTSGEALKAIDIRYNRSLSKEGKSCVMGYALKHKEDSTYRLLFFNSSDKKTYPSDIITVKKFRNIAIREIIETSLILNSISQKGKK